MNLQEFSSLYDYEKALENYRQGPILLLANCFNPDVIQTILHEKRPSIPELNIKYFEQLTIFRKSMESKNIEQVIRRLANFHYIYFLFRYEYEFISFLKFDGLYFNCTWFKASLNSDFPQDIICCKEYLPTSMKVKPFLKNHERLKDRLKKIFDGRENIDTEKIGSLKFENPFSMILRGVYSTLRRDNPNINPFRDAIDCLQDSDFEREWKLNKKWIQERNEIASEKYKIPEVTDCYDAFVKKNNGNDFEKFRIYYCHLFKGNPRKAIADLINATAPFGWSQKEIYERVLKISRAEYNRIKAKPINSQDDGK